MRLRQFLAHKKSRLKYFLANLYLRLMFVFWMLLNILHTSRHTYFDLLFIVIAIFVYIYYKTYFQQNFIVFYENRNYLYMHEYKCIIILKIFITVVNKKFKLNSEYDMYPYIWLINKQQNISLHDAL